MTSALGTISLVTNNTITVDGLAGVSSLGNLGIIGKCNVGLTGFELTTGTPGATVWGKVDDSQTPNWNGVDDSQTTNWNEIAA